MINAGEHERHRKTLKHTQAKCIVLIRYLYIITGSAYRLQRTYFWSLTLQLRRSMAKAQIDTSSHCKSPSFVPLVPSELDPCLPFLLHNKLFTDTNGKREIVVASITICSRLWNWTGPIRSLFERNALFETRQNWFYARLLQCSIFERSIMYDKCSISQRLIVFDWQNCWVSSIKFNYRTHSKSVERLEFD